MPPIPPRLTNASPSAAGPDADSDSDFEFIGSTPATNNSSRAPSADVNAAPTRRLPRLIEFGPHTGRPAGQGAQAGAAGLAAARHRAARARATALEEEEDELDDELDADRPVRVGEAPPPPRVGGAAIGPARIGNIAPARRWPHDLEDGLDTPGSSAHNAILLDSDSDDDAPRPAQAVGGPAGAAGPRGPLSPGEFRNHMDALDRSLNRASRFERRARMQAERDRRLAENAADRLNRQVRSPEPEAGPAEPLNRLGGAAIRHGNVQYHFRPNRAPEVRYVDLDGNLQNQQGHGREEMAGFLPGVEALLRGVDIRGIRAQAAILLNMVNPALHAGPAGGLDAKSILDAVKAETPPPVRDGFARTWDPEDLVKDLEEKEKRGVVVEIDERGRVVPEKRKPRGQVYLACSACPEPLRVGSATRTPEDRVWALRCGHLLDQRCYSQLAQPADDVPLLDGPAPKRRRSGRTTRATRASRATKKQHEWACPVAGCGREHVSEMVEDEWAPVEGLGGVQLYV